METLIVHPDNQDYDPEFVAMVLKGDEEIKAGKGIKVDVDNLWK